MQTNTTTNTTATRAGATRPDGLTLRPLQDGRDGLAVCGHPHRTYKHRHELRAHGARWNATRRQWEATNAQDCDTLRRWLAPQGATPAPSATPHTAIYNPYL